MARPGCYVPADLEVWTGRVDEPCDRDAARWHQVVEPLDPTAAGGPAAGPGFCLVGYCCDRGVARNQGRPGAAAGPLEIRRQLANLPVRFGADVHLYDAGDVRCPDAEVEAAQRALAEVVAGVLARGLFPIVLGGGHDLAVGHHQGIARHLPPQRRIGIVNFDAHLDLRPPEPTPNSGSAFAEIAAACAREGRAFCYLCLGAQTSANTVKLFKRAAELGAEVILAKSVEDHDLGPTRRRLDAFIAGVDSVYLTLCADVLSSAFAPGVSAPQPLGLNPETALRLLKHVLASGKVVAFDLAEVAPRFDRDSNTAKVAAVIVYALVDALLASRDDTV